MAKKQVIGGLKWVKGEIATSLQPVRELASGTASLETHLGPVLRSLEQVQGVLLALNLRTPARLVEEILRLVERLGESDGARLEESRPVIAQALDQLTNHLDRLDAGFDEPPLSLWSIINALRAARDQLPLTHSELLSFALLDRSEDSQWIPEEIDILAEVMRQVRPQFHRHLVEWYRGDAQGLAQLERLFHQLKDYLKEGLLADLFALAERLVQGLGAGEIEATAQTRTLVGHLDWVLKPLTQRPPVWPEIDAKALIERLLERLAGTGIEEPAFGELRLRYAPPSPLAQAASIQSGLGDEAAQAAQAVKLLEELGELKGRFDELVSAQEVSTESIRAFSDRLRVLASRLDEVEIGQLPARLRALADQFQTLDPQTFKHQPERLESYAMELLGIESVLVALASRRDADAQTIAPDLDLADLTAATLREAGYELLRVKEAIEDWQRAPQSFDLLTHVPRHLENVSGALRILSEHAAADLAKLTAELIQGAYLRHRHTPTQAEFEHLAEAIAGLELYLGHLQKPMPLGETLIDRAGQSISALQLKLSALAETPPETIAESKIAELERAEPEPEAEALPPLELAPQAEAPSSPVAEPPPAEAVEEEGETAFIEIFREEAAEEIDKARGYLGRLQADPSDKEARGKLRRCFHTLKGSGRLVGALQIGDFAQAMEFLLNRLIELDAPPSAEMLDCLAEALRVLPDLVEADTSGRAFDIAPHIERASRLRETAGVPAAATPVAEPSVAVPPVEQAQPVEADHDSLFVTDPELLAIFRGEAEEHLAVLRAFVERLSPQAGAMPGEGGVAPDESLIRALHTLTGSARMSGVESIARVTKALEERIKPAAAGGLALGPSLIDCFSSALAAIEARLQELPETGAAARALSEVLSRIQAEPIEPIEIPAPIAPETEAAAPIETWPTELVTEEALPELSFEVAAELPEAGVVSGPEVLEPIIEPPLVPAVEEAAVVEGEVPQAAPPAPEIGPSEAPVPSPAETAIPEPPPQAPTPEPPPVQPAGPTAPAAEAPAAPEPELVAVFLEEARDLLDKLDHEFRNWQLHPQEKGLLAGINRLLHTLKGGARLAGLMTIGNLAHALESRLKAIDEDPRLLNELTLELAQRGLDTLALQVDAVEQGAAIPDVSGLIAELSGAAEGPAQVSAPPPSPPSQVQPTAPEAGAGPTAGPIEAVPQIRVRSDLLNRLVNLAGEVSIYRSRLSQRNTQLGFSLAELDQTVIRLRSQLRELELETQAQIRYRIERDRETAEPSLTASDYDEQFDPLEFDRFSRLQELSGFLAETLNDLVSVKEILSNYQREITDLLNQQARLAEDLQDGLLRTRMVPFVQVVPRLQRLVRQTADTLGKSARLEIIGPEVELDRTILDRLVAPLEHLLRNAVDHGIEDTKTRIARGKPATGLVTLALRREGNDVVISLSDDGRGLDLEAIRQQAIRRGLMTPDAKLPEEAILQFIMEPGFTTSGKVTQISGRGVGLDVVASEIKAANGTLQIESIPGKGARFTIRLPLTLALIEVFLVTVGETIYAVPHSTVEGVGRISRDELMSIYAEPTRTYTVRGHHYRVAYLGQALEPGATIEPELGERRWFPLLLARIGDQRVALQADSILESQRILVKPLGPQLAGVRWLSGGTILPDGRVALILDALALVRSGAIREQVPIISAAEPTAAPISVLVVDDSLTVRRVTSRLLKRQNMEVMTAKDGVEALTLLDERIPDVVLLDVEMPRMDGYELTRHIRRSERLKHLPIIMITSRTGTKHREYAAQLGVDRYLGKPYQEAELLAEIEAVVRRKS